MSKILKIGALVLIAGVLGIATLAVTTGAFAQDAGEGDTDPDGFPFGFHMRGGFGRVGQMMGGAFGGPGEGVLADYADEMHAALASALGITVDELDAAREEGKTLYQIAEEQGVEIESVWDAMAVAREEMVAQALADGAITDEQAEWMLEFEGGARGGFGHHMGGFGGNIGGFGGHMMGAGPMAEYMDIMHGAVAGALGMSEEELYDAMANGKTMWDLAEEKGIDADELFSVMEAAREQAINKALEDGVITEEQAEWMLDHMGGAPGGFGACHGDADGSINPQGFFPGGMHGSQGRGGMMGGSYGRNDG